MNATSKPKIVLTGMGHFHPGEKIHNNFFHELDIDSSAEWIEERVGIKSRHSVMDPSDILRLRRGEVTRDQLIKDNKFMSAASMCKDAWEGAWQRGQESGSSCNVDTLICGTSVPDWDIPANACSVAAKLGIERCSAFDVNSACSSFVVDLHVMSSLMQTGSTKIGAIANPERYSTRLDYSDRSSCVLFGDAATMALLDTGEAEGLELIDTIVRSSPSGFEHVQIPVNGTFRQNGQAVQKFAITKTISITIEILERHGLSKSDINYFIGHQANLRMLTSAARKQGIPDDRHLFNVDTCGNQGAAGAPAVLSSHWDKFKSGDIIVVAVVGSGLTWGAALFRKI